jgi:hypothetical protein
MLSMGYPDTGHCIQISRPSTLDMSPMGRINGGPANENFFLFFSVVNTKNALEKHEA